MACAPLSLSQTETELQIGGDGGWIEVAAPEPGSDAAVIADARRLIADGEPGRAFGIIDDWLEEHKLTRHPLLAQAYLVRGDARLARGDEYKALFDYETVIKDFPSDSAFVTAVERELDIGTRYLHGLRRKWLGLARIENAEPLGTELLMRVQERLPGSRLAERAAIELADYFYREGELELAAQMYDILLRNFPDTEHRVHAMERRIYSNIGRFKGPRYSTAGLVESRALIEDYQARFPVEASRSGLGDALAARIDHSQGAQMLETARWYLQRDDEVSARFTLQRLVRRHPTTAAAVEAVAMMQDRGWWTEAASDEPLFDEPLFDEPAGPSGLRDAEADLEAAADSAAREAAQATPVRPAIEQREIGQMTPVTEPQR